MFIHLTSNQNCPTKNPPPETGRGFLIVFQNFNFVQTIYARRANYSFDLQFRPDNIYPEGEIYNKEDIFASLFSFEGSSERQRTLSVAVTALRLRACREREQAKQ